MKHKARVLTPEEVMVNRSNAYKFIDFETYEIYDYIIKVKQHSLLDLK